MDEIERVSDIAISDFFAGLAEATGAKSGDLAPDAYATFEAAARAVTAEWMRANVPGAGV